jgi:hypothetical protein
MSQHSKKPIHYGYVLVKRYTSPLHDCRGSETARAVWVISEME